MDLLPDLDFDFGSPLTGVGFGDKDATSPVVASNESAVEPGTTASTDTAGDLPTGSAPGTTASIQPDGAGDPSANAPAAADTQAAPTEVAAAPSAPVAGTGTVERPAAGEEAERGSSERAAPEPGGEGAGTVSGESVAAADAATSRADAVPDVAASAPGSYSTADDVGRTTPRVTGAPPGGGLGSTTDTVAGSAAPPPGAPWIFTDLATWAGRELASEDGRVLGHVLGVRIDMLHTRPVDCLVLMPAGLRTVEFLIPVDHVVERGFPGPLVWGQPADALDPTGEPVEPAADTARFDHEDAVRLAFERQRPGSVTGDVMERVKEHGSRFEIQVVKIRDERNHLYRLDLGPAAWFDGRIDLPAVGATLTAEVVKSRDATGPVWYASSIFGGEARVVLRTPSGAPREGLVLPSPTPITALRVHDILGDTVLGAARERTIGNITGLLLEQRSGRVTFALLKPTAAGDETGVQWVVPTASLQPVQNKSWRLPFDFVADKDAPSMDVGQSLELNDTTFQDHVHWYWERTIAGKVTAPADK